MTRHYTGRGRLAALRVLAGTTLGQALDVDDDGTVLAVGATKFQLSSGEMRLYDFLLALGDHRPVSLFDLVAYVDREALDVCHEAFGVLIGREA